MRNPRRTTRNSFDMKLLSLFPFSEYEDDFFNLITLQSLRRPALDKKIQSVFCGCWNLFVWIAQLRYQIWIEFKPVSESAWRGFQLESQYASQYKKENGSPSKQLCRIYKTPPWFGMKIANLSKIQGEITHGSCLSIMCSRKRGLGGINVDRLIQETLDREGRWKV